MPEMDSGADPTVEGGGAAVSSSALPPSIQFSGHSAYIVTVAKLCRETNKFTDVKIQCKDGDIQAHR